MPFAGAENPEVLIINTAALEKSRGIDHEPIDAKHLIAFWKTRGALFHDPRTTGITRTDGTSQPKKTRTATTDAISCSRCGAMATKEEPWVLMSTTVVGEGEDGRKAYERGAPSRCAECATKPSVKEKRKSEGREEYNAQLRRYYKARKDRGLKR